MERVGFVLKVRPECLDEYKRRHREVWPEMRAALRSTGWHNYSLFLREDGLLFGYLAGMARTDGTTRWQAEMAPLFEHTGGRAADRALLRLEEVFHLD